MKTSAVVAVVLCIVAGANAFTAPMMATRAVGKAAPKSKAAPAPKSPPPESKGYPSFDTSGFKFPGISGGGNKGPSGPWQGYPDFSDPKLQIERDPAFYAAAAKTRLAKNKDFAYDDGLTELERKQRSKGLASFLTGSAKSQADTTTIRSDIGNEDPLDYFGIGSDRFQLLFISIFGLFTLVGCLSGTITLD